MKWTVERIRTLCREFCGKCDVDFNVPIIINKRMKETLGLCHAIYDEAEGWLPTMLEFSQQLLEFGTDASVTAIIGHECAHFLTLVFTHEDHGHDEVFKHFCSLIDVTNDGTQTEIEYTVSPDRLYKYTFYCTKCGGFVGGQHHTCDRVKNYQLYISNCCHADIELRRNW